MGAPPPASASEALMAASWVSDAAWAADWGLTLLLCGAAVRVTDSLLLSRDEKLATNALRALEMGAGGWGIV